MKSRLSSTIWMLVFLNALALGIGLSYSAGKQAANGGSPLESSGTIVAVVIAIGMSVVLAWRLGAAILTPVSELASFSERLAAGDGKARADVGTNDEFGYIAENLNRAVAKVSKASSNQEANDSLQRSIPDLLAVITQVAPAHFALLH